SACGKVVVYEGLLVWMKDTVAGATKALSALDNALQSIDSNRASLGAVQNRLTSTIASLTNTSDNLSASRSRIQDADFASETAALSRSQVLQQAGMAMLSQANQQPQQVLALLR
ncbi:MAG: flagellin, partial [Pseudomonadota bacterium]